MKDVKPFDISGAISDKKRHYINEDIHNAIIDHVQMSIGDSGNLSKYLGCFSNGQLLDFLDNVRGRLVIERTRVSRELFSRLEVGDKVVVKEGCSYDEIPKRRIVMGRTPMLIRLDNGGRIYHYSVRWHSTMLYDELATLHCRDSKIPLVKAAPDMKKLLEEMLKSDRCDIAYFRISIENVLKKAKGEEQDEW
jgi:hypothetical protein